MEKLQQALQKARDQRGNRTDAAVPRAASARPVETDAPGSLEGRWAEIPSFEPDRNLMEKNLLLSISADRKGTPFDILRTKAQLLMQKNGWSRLGITSPSAACGKTTLACNLALGFTRQADIRVMLVELDLRRPSMARMFGIFPDHDVTELLSGKVSFAAQAIRIGDNMAVSMAQRPISDPTSVLLSQKARDTLAAIEESYAPDLVIFDLPPILVSDDTRAFLKEVDCAILVAKSETTSVAQIDNCEREIAEQSNVLGVVLNQCRHARPEEYGEY